MQTSLAIESKFCWCNSSVCLFTYCRPMVPLMMMVSIWRESWSEIKTKTDYWTSRCCCSCFHFPLIKYFVRRVSPNIATDWILTDRTWIEASLFAFLWGAAIDLVKMIRVIKRFRFILSTENIETSIFAVTYISRYSHLIRLFLLLCSNEGILHLFLVFLSLILNM